MPSPTPMFTGVAVALVTLFDDHARIDPEATAALATDLVDRGIATIVVSGTTGEAAHLSTKERLSLLDAVLGAVGERATVVLGTGNLSAGVSVPELTRRAGEHGAHGALVLSPHHGDAVALYRDVIAAAGPLPVLAYHYPAVSAPGIAIAELAELDDLGIAGLKDSTGDPARLIDELAELRAPVYTGSSSMVAYAGLLGATGAILAAANLEPERCAAAFAGDIDAQRGLRDAHHVVGAGIAAIKTELARTRGTSTVTR